MMPMDGGGESEDMVRKFEIRNQKSEISALRLGIEGPLQEGQELAEGGGAGAVALEEDAEGAPHVGVFDLDGGQGAVCDLLLDGASGDDGDAVLDFDGAFHRFDVVELDGVMDVDALIAEGFIDDFAGGLVGLEGDEALALEIAEGDRGAAGKGMTRMADHHQAIIEEGEDLQALLFGGVADEAEIDFAFHDGAVEFPGAAVLDADLDAGMGGLEGVDVGGELVESDGVDDADAEAALDDVGEGFEAVVEVLVDFDDFAAGAEEGFALGGEGEGAAAALDEADLVALLEGADLLGDGALGDAVGGGGAGEAAGLGEVTEDFEGLDLHGEKSEIRNQKFEGERNH
jgi:hypothetical protein